MRHFDLVVVGGGHAGCEAAAVAARLGRKVLLVTMSKDHLARLSCNPAIGGLAKGNLVRELDALGGLMARVADASTLQFRVLNTRKGLAVQSSRAQVDIDHYPRCMKSALEAIEGLEILEGEVVDLDLDQGVQGLWLANGEKIGTRRVILTAGTFLAARMHRGSVSTPGGRVGDASSDRLSDRLRGAGLRMARLKTGTTPRLNAQSVDWDRLEVQEDSKGRFSFAPPSSSLRRIACHLAYTNTQTHSIIRENVDRSAVYGGGITGAGPRYCPSIEDKVVRFPDRDRHLLFLEPEGLESQRVYVNGMSTSLPDDVQIAMVRSVKGLESAEILQFGYAVEYDYCDPRDLDPGLQHRAVPGLFLAGQVNGTSGYEEAAVQGFVAGVSAAQGETFQLGREQAYIGVLIDDLVTRGVGGEPYRMFTSRAEHRLLLREDNADRRLMPLGRALGLIDDATWASFSFKVQAIEHGRNALQRRVHPDVATRERVESAGLGPLRKTGSAEALLRRPGVGYSALARALDLPELSAEAAEQVETDVKYAGYLAREQARALQTQRLSGQSLAGVVFDEVPGLSVEVVQRLGEARPATLAAAGRLPGVTPAAVDVLATWLVRSAL